MQHISLFANKLSSLRNKIEIGVIEFEGCNIGDNPHEFLELGTLFRSKTISGYTAWYKHDDKGLSITVPYPTDDAGQSIVKTAFNDRKKFFVTSETIPTFELKKEKTYNYLLEWFSNNHDKVPFNLDEDTIDIFNI